MGNLILLQIGQEFKGCSSYFSPFSFSSSSKQEYSLHESKSYLFNTRLVINLLQTDHHYNINMHFAYKCSLNIYDLFRSCMINNWSSLSYILQSSKFTAFNLNSHFFCPKSLWIQNNSEKFLISICQKLYVLCTYNYPAKQMHYSDFFSTIQIPCT